MKILKVVSLNIIILAFILGILELIAIIMGPTQKNPYKGEIFGQNTAPYVEYINNPNLKNGRGSWTDQLSDQKLINFVRSVNNFGFREDEDFDWVSTYKKGPDERVVLITGGSAVAGVGASSDKKVISAQIEKALNSEQQKYKYRVINLANGGWVSFQEFIGLALWGKTFNPDWIITMDGRNDIAVACASGQGAVFPKHHHAVTSYTNSYLKNSHPVFYRGWLENQIIKHSAFVRIVTGYSYIPDSRFFPQGTDSPTVGVKTTWKDVDDQVVFYVKTVDSILNISPTAKYIISMQPLIHSVNWLDNSKNLSLEEIKQINADKACGLKTYQNYGLFYFYRKSDIELRNLISQYNKKSVSYFNMNYIFPNEAKERNSFFIDEAHLTDKGQELLGKFYAQKILESDFPN